MSSEAATTVPKTCETLATKVQKHVDSLHAKIAKQAEEIAALKAANSALKASNSRIRRIPKKPTAAEPVQA